MLKLQQERTRRALIRGKQSSADLQNARDDPMTVKRSQDIRSLAEQGRQSALQDVCHLVHRSVLLVSNRKDGTLPLGKQQVEMTGEF
jgi:hypothetical protein